MKSVAVIISVILLFSVTNVAFSQTISNSTDQCKTVMHEQIVQKKVDGKLRLEKIQVPMKICKEETVKTKSSLPSKPKISHKKISSDLQKLIDSGQEKVKIYINVNGTVPDFRPIKPSGEYYTMAELTKEQRKAVTEKRTDSVKELQKDLIKFITEN